MVKQPNGAATAEGTAAPVGASAAMAEGTSTPAGGSAATAEGTPAPAGASAAVEPSKVNTSSPGAVKTSQFKKRKVVVRRKKIAAAVADKVASVGGDAAGGDAIASVSMPQQAATASVPTPQQAAVASVSMPQEAALASVSMPQEAPLADASPVAQALEPTTHTEVSAPKPANAEASASAAEQNPTDTDADAAAASTKGKGVSAGSSGGDRKMKSRKERPRKRAMTGKGKEIEDDAGRNRMGSKSVAKKGGRGDTKGAGFIFMCNQQTKQECYQKRLFGLPHGKIGMVKKIRPGAKLFLYDFDLKLLYGVYKAASSGGLNLVREAFHEKFPAQVKFKIDKDCLPLRESSFKHAIKENYSAKSKFDPELTSKQVQRLIALFKPATVPQSVPNNRLHERRHYEERREPYRFEERRRSFPTEEVRRLRFDEQRHTAVIHAPVEDPYRAPHFAPLPFETRLGSSLANVQDNHHLYYEPARLAPEPRHIPLALDSRHAPPVLERQHTHPVPEPRHVPLYYRALAPSDDSYYRSVGDLGSERFADRTMTETTARDPIITRDYTTLPREYTERSVELYRTGETRGAHVEELYHPRELALRTDHVGISSRADRLEELYRSEQLAARAVDLPRHSTYITPAYVNAEVSRRSVSARANTSGGPASSLYSSSGRPIYR